MANETVNQPTQKERDELAMEVAWELDKIARSLPDFIPTDEDQTHFLIRAISGRMLQLTKALMCVFGGESATSEENSFERMRDIVLVTGITQG
jgi:hypothetical protein